MQSVVFLRSRLDIQSTFIAHSPAKPKLIIHAAACRNQASVCLLGVASSLSALSGLLNAVALREKARMGIHLVQWLLRTHLVWHVPAAVLSITANHLSGHVSVRIFGLPVLVATRPITAKRARARGCYMV